LFKLEESSHSAFSFNSLCPFLCSSFRSFRDFTMIKDGTVSKERLFLLFFFLLLLLSLPLLSSLLYIHFSHTLAVLIGWLEPFVF
jgi:hypothetical protein